MALEELLTFLNQLQPAMHLVVSLALLATIVVVYTIVSRSITSTAKRLEMDPHVQNSFRFILRVVMIIVAVTAVFTMYELPTTWFVGSSALIGAALGFGSSQSINNFIAGLYVIVSRPFRVKDYVKIGDAEGQVEEISINYTKLYTPSFNLLLLPNLQVLNSRILNCTHEGYIKYSFSLSVPHAVLNKEIIEKCIEPAIEEFHKKYHEKQLRKPEYYFETSTSVGRTFKFRIFIPKGDAKTLYMLQPELSSMIMNLWDVERRK
ncbi:MAG: mechanosensitive ion channel domain-containing protein [Candidatus Bathyarchaeota archaeon]